MARITSPVNSRAPLEHKSAHPGVHTTQRRDRIRLTILCLMFFAVAIAGVSLRGTDLRIWWLSRQSLETLAQQSSAADADSTARYVYARKLFENRRYQEALTAFQHGRDGLAPNASDVIAQRTLAHLGYLYAIIGDDKQAAMPLKRAQQLNDDDPLTHLGLGLYFMKREKHDYAENQLKIVVHLDPSNAEGWYFLGKNYNELKSFGPAVESLEQSVKLDPANSVAWEQLGQAYANDRKFDKAIPVFRKACSLDPPNIAYRTSLGSAMALSAQNQQEYTDAVKVLEDCIRAAPDNDTAELQLGSVHMRFHNYIEAERHLHRTLELAPNDEGGWFKLSQLEQVRGDKAAHEQAYQRHKILSDISHEYMVLRTKLGADPNNSQLRIELARFHARHNNLEGAISDYEDVLKNMPGNPEATVELAAVKQQLAAARARDPKGVFDRVSPPQFHEAWASDNARPNAGRSQGPAQSGAVRAGAGT